MKKVILAAAALLVAVGSVSVHADTPLGPSDMVHRGMGILAQPQRILDTRQAGSSDHVVLPQGPYWGSVAIVNIAVTNGDAAGYATLYDCKTLPETSNVNWSAGETESNLAFVPLQSEDDLSVFDPAHRMGFCVHLSQPADVVIDLVAWSFVATYFRLP